MDNKGYTLIELVVSMLITAIVITIIISFMSTNSSSYNYVSENINLQIESQTVMNQLNDIILEANWIDKRDIGSDCKAMIIYNTVDADVVLLNKPAEKLYLIEDLTESELSTLASVSYSDEDNLMATHVTELSFSPEDKDDLLQNSQICLTVDFTAGSQAYHIERNIKFRNRLVER